MRHPWHRGATIIYGFPFDCDIQKMIKEFMEFCGWVQIASWKNLSSGNKLYLLTDRPEIMND